MTYTDPSVANERRTALVEIVELLLDAETKIEEGFARPEILDDLMHRIADAIAEVLPDQTGELGGMRVGSFAYAYPAHCDGCGQEPGTGVRFHGCDVCAERNRLNDAHSAEPLDTGETTRDLGAALYSSTHVKTTAKPGHLPRIGITKVEEGGAYK